VIQRSTESVISVSPDDLKPGIEETPQETIVKQEPPQREKPEVIKRSEQNRDDRRPAKWRQPDHRRDIRPDRQDRQDRFDRPDRNDRFDRQDRPERKEYDNGAPRYDSPSRFDTTPPRFDIKRNEEPSNEQPEVQVEQKPANEPYYSGDIIVDAPVRDLPPEPVQREKKEGKNHMISRESSTIPASSR
jgi:hypothetical protein